MSKKIILTFSTLLASLAISANSSVYAAQEDDQQLTTDERAEVHRKRKPDIAKRSAIRAALRAMRSNGALKRASRRRSNDRATQRNNRIAARANRAATAQTTEADGEEVTAIKHVLICDTEANCQAAVVWGNDNNFNTTGVLTSEGHGGETMYHLFLRQEVVPDEDTITSESDRVHAGIETLEGIRYATWMVDLDPSGEQDGGGNQ